MNAKRTVVTAVSDLQEVNVEYNRTAGKLRISDQNDNTLAILSNDEVYRVAPAAPEGHVIISRSEKLPDLARTLIANKIVEQTAVYFDEFAVEKVMVARVLI